MKLHEAIKTRRVSFFGRLLEQSEGNPAQPLTFFGTMEEAVLASLEDVEVNEEQLEDILCAIVAAGYEEQESLYILADFEYEDHVEDIREQLVQKVEKILER